jgi:hypothetical protein
MFSEHWTLIWENGPTSQPHSMLAAQETSQCLLQLLKPVAAHLDVGECVIGRLVFEALKPFLECLEVIPNPYTMDSRRSNQYPPFS